MVGSFKKKILVIAIIAVISFSTITLAVFQLQQGPRISGSNLSWTFNEDDELSFSVSVTGSYSDWTGETTSTEYNWSSDNVTIRIIELPEIPSTLDTTTFITNIICPTKIQVLSTDIPVAYSNTLVALLSKFLVPVGSWELLDRMFDDSLPSSGGYPTLNDLEFDTDYYAGVLSESDFYLGVRRFGDLFPNWKTTSWRGWINLESGIPDTAVYTMTAPMCTSSSSMSMSVGIND
jgi:hypothetical protein